MTRTTLSSPRPVLRNSLPSSAKPPNKGVSTLTLCLPPKHVKMVFENPNLPAMHSPGIMVNLNDPPTNAFCRRTRAPFPYVVQRLDAIEVLLPTSASATTTIAAAAGKATFKRGPTSTAKSREELFEEAAHLKFFVIVMEQKGGVGKSLSTVVINETLKIDAEKEILLIDADVVNKNLSRVGLTKSHEALNAGRIDFEGFLFDAAERLIDGEIGGVVIDSAAGGEDFFRPQLAELASMLRQSDANARLIIARPLTLSPLVHENILQFGTKYFTPNCGALLIRNMGQGRTIDDFKEFDNSLEYEQMKEMGMVECPLESAGAKYSDLITGFNLSFADIALRESDDLGLQGRQLEIAKRVFTRPVRLFMARWLFRQTTAFRRGLIEAAIRTLG